MIKNLYSFSKKLLFTLLLTILFISCGSDESSQSEKEEVILPKTNVYGFIDDSLTIQTAKVDRNETLTDILLPYKVPYQKIVEIASVDTELFDERKIRAGNEFFIFSTNDSLNRPQYIVYKSDLLNYTVIDLTDSLKITRGKKEIERKTRSIAGIINSSLFLTVSQQDVSEVLALKLADLFAWQIDFYGIQKGDYFKVIFEEAYVDGEYYGIGKINAALFGHKGTDFYGFYFDQGDGYDYFDEKGGSLRKAFLKAPLKFSRISSRYQKRRLHPVLKVYRPHLGVDYAAPTGTPVRAIGDGVVLEARRKGGNGNYVKIKHNTTYQSGYLHLSKYGKGIKAGVRVKQGQIIGYVGSTGLSSGPHLDLRFWKNGQLVNYLNVEFPPSKPIEDQHITVFDSIKTDYWKQLDQISFPSQNEVVATK